jgi:hypothetical protein
MKIKSDLLFKTESKMRKNIPIKIKTHHISNRNKSAQPSQPLKISETTPKLLSKYDLPFSGLIYLS